MSSEKAEILNKINQLISLIENSNIAEIDKFKILKVLLTIKLRLIEFKESIHGRKNDSSKKYEIILGFIQSRGGRVNSAELASLGISGRSLRRYIKDLRGLNKLKIEKSGRNYFYSVV